MKALLISKQKGLTLIELLVALVICAVVIGAIYRLFVAQTRAYTVQDQVAEVQQSVRSAMELLLRDLRMTGYDDDCLTSEAIPITVPTPLATPVAADSITMSYEYHNELHTSHQRHTVRYWRDALTSELRRQLTRDAVADPEEVLLNNVDALTFNYGIDANEDGVVESWEAALGVGVSKVIAVRVTLTARPPSVNPDVQTMVSPRTLISAVTLRNRVM